MADAEHLWDAFWAQRDGLALQARSLIQNFRNKELEALVLDMADPLNLDSLVNGWPLLHYAVNQGNDQALILLLKNGADVNLPSQHKRPPLSLAVVLSRFQAANILLQYHADPNLQDTLGNTSLHEALYEESPEMISLLVEHGAKEVQNHKGRLPSDLTERRQLLDVLASQIKLSRLKHSKLVMEDITVVGELGQGQGFSKVYLCKVKGFDELLAVKAIEKSKVMQDQRKISLLLTQKNVMRRFDCPFLMRLSFCLQNKDFLLIGMKHCAGGSLRKKLKRCGALDEGLAKVYAAEIFLGLKTLHQNDIIYRDLKPQNVALDGRGHLVLIDFGVSREQVQKGKLVNQRVGTLSYMSFELMHRQGYNYMTDWFSLGVLVFEMLTGKTPFELCSFDDQIYEESLIEERLPLQYPATVSPEARSLVAGLLKRKPGERLGQKEIEGHEWFRGLDWDRVKTREDQLIFQPCEVAQLQVKPVFQTSIGKTLAFWTISS